jgi:choline dehydrogenase-like flavoprotein
MESAMASEPALAAVLRATTLESSGADTHDAIIVGAGAAGGLAAMLLAQSGLRVLVLDASLPVHSRAPLQRLAGGLVRRLSTHEKLNFLPPTLIPKARTALRILGKWRQPIQSQCYAWQWSPNAFVDDRDCPYVTPPDHPFVWVRARILGGRVAVPRHGKQYYRLGSDDFLPNDGLSPPWPFQPQELDSWYNFIERKLKLSGMRDNLPWLPDSELADVLGFTESEEAFRDKIIHRWPGARPILSRYAPPLQTLEAAAQTGRLQCRQGAIVRQIRVDGVGRVNGVVWIDHHTRTERESSAPLVFLCASALESTRILLLSRSRQSSQGLGAASGVLGRHLMDHVVVSAEGVGAHRFSGQPPDDGRCLYLPRFDARAAANPNPGRGFGLQVYRLPVRGGQTYFAAFAFAEMAPRLENRVTLDPNRRDAWGIPVLRIDCSHNEAELLRARDQTQALRELAEIAEVKLTRIDETPRPPGSAIHECGTARMGADPLSSVLDPNNQCWDARGLYVTDASCFPSQGSQNPTLTILALTARACHHALDNTPTAAATPPSKS